MKIAICDDQQNNIEEVKRIWQKCMEKDNLQREDIWLLQ